MKDAIVIYANCHNSSAKGDFAFAGALAKDIVRELHKEALDIEVILVSTLDGMSRYQSLYGKPVDGKISIEGETVGLSSLELFDAVKYKVVGFIEANRCKYAPAELVKKILSPDSKFLFVGNVNQHAISGLFSQTLYLLQLEKGQPNLYQYFDCLDIFMGTAGPGKGRIGLPGITKSEDLPALTFKEKALLPTTAYGFMYASAIDLKDDSKLISQYIKLTGFSDYVLVGNFSTQKYDIKYAFDNDKTLISSQKFPQITYYDSLQNGVMRRMASQASSNLVLSTGSLSTLEVLHDGKLPFYQRYSESFTLNDEFVASWAIAVKSMVADDTSLFGAMPDLIIELSDLLFAYKPLSKQQMERTNDLLSMSSVSSRLISYNQDIVERANGRIAPQLLSFIGAPKRTQEHVQLARVCDSLRKSSETGSPVHGQALRRAAAWGRLFELKVLIASMSSNELNSQDLANERAALHWAVKQSNSDCARALIDAGAAVDIQDKEGKTPLHEAVINRDNTMIQLLIESGASVDICDVNSKSPIDCADHLTQTFISSCMSPCSKKRTTVGNSSSSLEL
ncbi:Dot/Icm T4SS effector AnkY/LegA9 [Legionella hackeliae]|uniref:Uncharacterized protein n=1 Tax=Legionella hackeliae TaxID=449 RepID=A0A0A8US65_LEGHA|nr:Dot/Icm T4SS effector AnkY/LegA9 [Legionella hackeliae]CEK09589.1 conserved protein of unknown function [ankyrin repeat] [Legionella hackeliae]STX49500.1 Ankyrin-repeat containing protein. Substrate of the Dot/Icm secretion system [Legionella hackeliae]